MSVSEIIVRLAISLATQPEGPAKLDARKVGAVVRPYVAQLLAR